MKIYNEPDVEKVGDREIKYFPWYNDKGECCKQYLATTKLRKVGDGTSDTYTYFDVELPTRSVRDVPYIGVFEEEKELYSYCEYMQIKGKMGDFVAWLKGKNRGHYVLILTDELASKGIYYLTVGRF